MPSATTNKTVLRITRRCTTPAEINSINICTPFCHPLITNPLCCGTRDLHTLQGVFIPFINHWYVTNLFGNTEGITRFLETNFDHSKKKTENRIIFLVSELFEGLRVVFLRKQLVVLAQAHFWRITSLVVSNKKRRLDVQYSEVPSGLILALD